MSGAALCLYDPKIVGISPLGKWLTDSKTTIWTSTPTIFREFVSTLSPAAIFPKVRIVRLHGDRTLHTDFRACVRHFADTCLLRNDLGMTELNRISQFIADNNTAIASPFVPVGYPYPGVEYWIENEVGERARPGEVGEIVLRSIYLSPGYYAGNGLPVRALTESSVGSVLEPAPFRTGDRGMIDGAGCLHHLGRNNGEVKVRGYRVNLSSIESVLCAHENVRNAVVTATEDTNGDDQLIAFVVAEGQVESDSLRRQLIGWLESQLSNHMLPSHYRFLDTLPLNENGKVSRRDLISASPGVAEIRTVRTPPNTRIEQTIAGLWSTILGLDEIGIHDPFLELGGNSLQVMRIAARVQEEFGVDIPPGRDVCRVHSGGDGACDRDLFGRHS